MCGTIRVQRTYRQTLARPKIRCHRTRGEEMMSKRKLPRHQTLAQSKQSSLSKASLEGSELPQKACSVTTFCGRVCHFFISLEERVYRPLGVVISIYLLSFFPRSLRSLGISLESLKNYRFKFTPQNAPNFVIRSIIGISVRALQKECFGHNFKGFPKKPDSSQLLDRI